MPDMLERICSKFTTSLHDWVGLARQFDAAPGERAWIEKLLVFFALEECQSILQDNPAFCPLWCRFSMKEGNDAVKEELRAFLKAKRVTRLHRLFAKKAVPMLQEFLFDFSLSRYSIPQATGRTKDAIPQQDEFRLILIAESEMGSPDLVLEDFLKLTCAPAPFKVMVYQGRANPKHRQSLLASLEAVYHNAQHVSGDEQWLLVGIPPYAQWIAKWDDPKGLPRHVHVLDVAAGELIEKDEWWTWVE